MHSYIIGPTLIVKNDRKRIIAMRVFLVASFILCILHNWNVGVSGFILHQVLSANNRPNEEELAKAITEDLPAIRRSVDIGHDDPYSLLVGVFWRATFVAKNSTIGRYLPESFGLQCFESDGSFTNTIRGIFRLRGTVPTIGYQIKSCNSTFKSFNSCWDPFDQPLIFVKVKVSEAGLKRIYEAERRKPRISRNEPIHMHGAMLMRKYALPKDPVDRLLSG